MCVHGVSVFTAVCVHFGWVNAEQEFRGWVTISLKDGFACKIYWTNQVPYSDISGKVNCVISKVIESEYCL